MDAFQDHGGEVVEVFVDVLGVFGAAGDGDAFNGFEYQVGVVGLGVAHCFAVPESPDGFEAGGHFAAVGAAGVA